MRIMAVIALLALAGPVFAESVPSNRDDYRYEAHRHDGVLYRLDKLTGKLERLDILGGTASWSEVPVMLSGSRPTNSSARNTGGKAASAASDNNVEASNESMAQLGDGARKRKLKLWDDNNNDISESITDADRRAAMVDIASYKEELLPSVLVATRDERLTGIIMIRNKGARRIEKMEVVLRVPVNGKEAPEEYTYLFVDGGGFIGPPQPGAEGRALLQNVDLPAPAGGMKGNADVKVTYIKFYSK